MSADGRGVEQAEIRTFFCRFCGEPYCAGGDDFHLNELVTAGACLDCHRTRLRREARVGGAAMSQRAYTPQVVPHCRACGKPITAEGGPFALADMQLRRQCAAHYYRDVRAR